MAYICARFLVIAIESVLIFFGLTLPLVNVGEFWIFDSRLSIIGMVEIFYLYDEWFLCILIASMGVIFPYLKIILRLFQFHTAATDFVGRFSTMDIFLVAIMVYLSKSSIFLEVNILGGIYFLGAGSILGLIQLERWMPRNKAPAV